MESWRETLWGKVYHCGTNHSTSQMPRTSVVACKQESTCQCRGHRFDPWSRKIPHAEEQLNPCTTATGARAPWSLALQLKPLQWVAPTPQQESLPPAPRESLCAAAKTEYSQKQIQLLHKKQTPEKARASRNTQHTVFGRSHKVL